MSSIEGMNIGIGIITSILGAVLAVTMFMSMWKHKERRKPWRAILGVLGVLTFWYPPIVLGMVQGIGRVLVNADVIFAMPPVHFSFMPSALSIIALLVVIPVVYGIYRDARRNNMSIYDWVMKHKPTKEDMANTQDPNQDLLHESSEALKRKNKAKAQKEKSEPSPPPMDEDEKASARFDDDGGQNQGNVNM